MQFPPTVHKHSPVDELVKSPHSHCGDSGFEFQQGCILNTKICVSIIYLIRLVKNYIIHKSSQAEHESLLKSMRAFLHNEDPKVGTFKYDVDNCKLYDINKVEKGVALDVLHDSYSGRILYIDNAYHIQFGAWINNVEDPTVIFDEVEKEFGLTREETIINE